MMQRPRPRPPNERVPPCSNALKRRGSTPAAMPLPVSVIDTAISPSPALSLVTVMQPSRGVNLTLLPSMFCGSASETFKRLRVREMRTQNTCCKRAGSPTTTSRSAFRCSVTRIAFSCTLPCSSCSACESTECTEMRWRFNSSLCSRILVTSSRSLMSSASRRTLRAMKCASSRTDSLSASSAAIVSASRSVGVSGVRSSWLRTARKRSCADR